MVKIEHIHPLCWYAGMKWSRVQILLHAREIGVYGVEVEGDGVRLDEVVRTENPNYLLLYVETAGAPAQTFTIRLVGHDGSTAHEIAYELRQRTFVDIDTFDAHDVVYLLIPDRWCDGTKDNPGLKQALFAGMRDDRWNQSFAHNVEEDGFVGRHTRHGGDLAGMTEHLDYLSELGVTAIWPTPLLENDNDNFTYHGYTTTDYYRIDPRFGTNEAYRDFVAKAQAKGLKVIQDMVFNHCSVSCFLFDDKISPSWFYTDKRMEVTNFKPYAQSDPALSQRDKDQLTHGCFFITSPAFNGSNPQVQDYLIQNSLWWIEFAGVNGIRQDSYPYNEFDEMSRWCQAVMAEHPGYNIVGETFMDSPVAISYWQQDSPVADRQSYLPSVMDFPLHNILCQACDENTDEWSTGLIRIQKYLGDDRVYARPDRLMTFLSNHDTNRFVAHWDLGENDFRYKQALTILLTIRGIPQLYYGDEISMAGCSDRYDEGQRQNFPGGFEGDYVNVFKMQNMMSRMWEYYKFTRQMLQWRKTPQVNRIIAEGRFLQHLVTNGIWVYARELDGQMITVMLNGTWEERSVDAAGFADVLPRSYVREMLSGRLIRTSGAITMNPRDIFILDWTQQF